MRRKAFVLGCLVTLWMLVQGCRTPTSVTLEIRTDALCSDLTDVDIIVTSSSERAELLAGYNLERVRTTTTSTSSCEGGRIGTLVVLPDGDRASLVVVAGIGVSASSCLPPLYGPQCIVARRAFAFVSHHSSRLPITLDLDCRGVPCNALSTCSKGICVSPEYDCSGSECAPATESGREEPVDGAVPPLPDGARPDDAGPGAGDAGDSGDPGDAAGDGATDGSAGDGGTVTGTCPIIATCFGSNGLTCTFTPLEAVCCYDTPDLPFCSGNIPLSPCAGPAGCCRSTKDCFGGTVCCASTPVPRSNTRFTCVPSNDCEVARRVCANSFSNGECGPFAACGTAEWSPGQLAYKRCQ